MQEFVLRNEEKMLIEAIGKRTQVGKTVFVKRDGYEFPVAEFDKTPGMALLRGEQLTADHLEALKKETAEVAEANRKIDEFNENRDPRDKPKVHKSVNPLIYHGWFVNFREAVPIDDNTVVEVEQKTGLSGMKWNELQKYAKGNGVDTLKKTRDEIEAELIALGVEE